MVYLLAIPLILCIVFGIVSANRQLTMENQPGWNQVSDGLWRYNELVEYKGGYYAHYFLDRPIEQVDHSMIKEKLVKITFPNDHTVMSYHGEFSNGKAHGHGALDFVDGSGYEGNFVNNQRNGCGTFWWKSGSKYVGEWKKDNIHGFGTFTWSNGDIYTGDFSNYYRNGRGTFWQHNGPKCVGVWLNNKIHGIAFMYIGIGANQQKFKSKWENGNLIWNKAVIAKG